MPIFTDKGGTRVYVPWHAVASVQEGVGGLECSIILRTTVLLLTQQGVGVSPPALAVVGTLESVSRAIREEEFNIRHAFPMPTASESIQ